jgi:predicted transcriptional regulator
MNIFDFNLEYSLFDVIISITLFVISFIVFVYFGYFRDMKERDKENYKIKDMLIEGYFHKFDEYNNIISDLRAKIDLIELKIGQKGENIYDQSKVASSNDIVNNESQRSASHVISPVTKSVIITEKKDDVKGGDFGLRLNTTDSILKMLEVPLTSREIQRRIKKSREHTSRLLKKLYSENIVMRDESTRPFKYKITDEGRKLLGQTTSSSG